MAIDFSYPNDEAIEATGVLDKWNQEHNKPENWIQDLIDRVQADIQRNQPSNPNHPNRFNWEGYSQEEKDAYKYYTDEVIETSAWNKIREEHEKTSAGKDNVEYETAPGEGNNYGVDNDSGFSPPVVHEWSDSQQQSNGVAVNTQALLHFVKQLEAIEPDGTGGLAWKARTEVEKVNIKPGGFAKAELLRRKIQGTGGNDDGLRGDTVELLMTVHQAIFNLRKNLTAVAKEYESGEELNKLTGDKLAEAMETAWAEIEKLKNHGNTSSTDLPQGTPDPQFTI